MPYTTLEDLIDRYSEGLLIQLTDRADVATGAIDEDAVADAIADADAVINGYVGARYKLPMAEVPPLLADVAKAISVYKLHSFEPSRKIEADYRDALATLKEISKGTITLDVAGVVPATTGSASARVTDRERPMTEDSMKGFI